jgi:hypothetical protein
VSLKLLLFAQHFRHFWVEDKFGSGMFWTFARLEIVGTTFLFVNAFGAIPHALPGFCPPVNPCQLWLSVLRAVGLGSAFTVGRGLHQKKNQMGITIPKASQFGFSHTMRPPTLGGGSL